MVIYEKLLNALSPLEAEPGLGFRMWKSFFSSEKRRWNSCAYNLISAEFPFLYEAFPPIFYFNAPVAAQYLSPVPTAARAP